MSVPEDLFALQCRGIGLKPEREYRFHPDRKFRFDFAWPDKRIGLEVEGGIWTGGRHTRGQGFEADCIKYAEAAIRGWRVIRVTPGMVKDGRALKYAEQALS